MGAHGELMHETQRRFLVRQFLAFAVRKLIVAKIDSMGFVVRRLYQRAAGKS